MTYSYIDIQLTPEKILRISFSEEKGTIMVCWIIKGRFTRTYVAFPATAIYKVIEAFKALAEYIETKTSENLPT